MPWIHSWSSTAKTLPSFTASMFFGGMERAPTARLSRTAGSRAAKAAAVAVARRVKRGAPGAPGNPDGAAARTGADADMGTYRAIGADAEGGQASGTGRAGPVRLG
ncbi:hypothetical protein A3838_13855 [Streptomyces badius]|nr:hypothetical protein A3838_13855 [Streptomyces badius]